MTKTPKNTRLFPPSDFCTARVGGGFIKNANEKLEPFNSYYLRSPNNVNSNGINHVVYTGEINFTQVNSLTDGILPAIVIDLSSLKNNF